MVGGTSSKHCGSSCHVWYSSVFSSSTQSWSSSSLGSTLADLDFLSLREQPRLRLRDLFWPCQVMFPIVECSPLSIGMEAPRDALGNPQVSGYVPCLLHCVTITPTLMVTSYSYQYWTVGWSIDVRTSKNQVVVTSSSSVKIFSGIFSSR